MKSVNNSWEYQAPEICVEQMVADAVLCDSGTNGNVGVGDLTDGGNFEW